MARRSKGSLSNVSYRALRRATPQENVRMGFGPKARHYVRADIKRVAKNTPSISARAYETKKSRDLYGVTPERATEQRRTGEIRYTSRAAAERTAKGQATRRSNRFVEGLRERIERDEVNKARIPRFSIKGKDRGQHNTRKVSADQIDDFMRWREQKLRGEWIDDITPQMYTTWLDYMAYYGDPMFEMLKAYPADRLGAIEE